MINLNIGLAYIHFALKRQAENRQHLILQGMTFLFAYYDSRKQSPRIEERQEADYNIARAYHMLGLSHLAILYYTRVLKKDPDSEGPLREDLILDASHNLQLIYGIVGNPELVETVTCTI
jgi:general transcription factor 3C polypeptide 3 (transcription factor C subunit 4)